MSIRMALEEVTPKQAEIWLNNNNNNRKLRSGVAERYADDMKAKKWTQCTVPISFYENGDIADGQHRLFAICDSGIAQRFIVLRGLDRASGLNIDTGLARSLVDNARISGANSGLSNELISCARAVDEGARQTKAKSNSYRLVLVAKHEEACRWALANGPRGRGLRNAMTLAAVARAWYHEADKERLKRCCIVMSTGLPDGPHEFAAVAIRNFFMASLQGSNNNVSLWQETFRKAQNAIWYFMRQKSLVVVKTVAKEVYPLPKDKAKK